MRRVNVRFLVGPAFVLFAHLTPAPSFASILSDDMRFRRYSVDQGLSQSQVSYIIQDHEGYLWLGTQDGLNRFDGYTFKIYRHDVHDSLSLSDNYINCLYEDSVGSLWIGTYSGGLNRYDRDRDGFQHCVHDSSAPSSLSGNNIWSITEDRAHHLWVGIWGGGLNTFDSVESRWTLFRHDPNDSLSLRDNRVLCQSWDHAGYLWVGTFSGLECYDPVRRTFTHIPTGTGRGSISQGMVTAILEDRANNLWVGTLDNGLNEISPDRSQVVRYAKSGVADSGFSSSRIAALMQDGHGTLWVATRDGGVVLLDQASGRIRRSVHNAYDPGSLSVDAAISLFRDSHGGIWVGTDGGGVNHYDPHRFKFQYLFSEPGNPHSLAHPLVRSICEDRAGRVWVGMMEGNVDALDPGNGKVVHYREQLMHHGLKSSCQILALLEDSDAHLWVGTDGGGLFLLDKKRNIVRHFRHDPLNPQSIPDDYVVALCEAHDGTIWIGGTSGMGLGILERKTYTCRTVARRGSAGNQLSGNYIWAIHEDKEGKLWLGTWGAGISVLDPATSTFRLYQHNPDNPASLSNNSILAFHESSSGVMWIGTLGGGLDECDRTNGTFIHHTEAHGLPNNTVSGVLEDGSGRLWLSTNKGVSCYDPARHTFRNYDVSDGLQSAEFNQGAYCQGSHGTMYFGGINGINIFVPENIVVDTSALPIRITSFKVLDRVTMIPRGADGSRSIVLSHDNNSFSFEFALLEFVAPEKSRYRYMLGEFDREWIEAGTRRYASYTNLAGGSYLFRVQAMNSDGIWHTQDGAIAIQVLPPYWETLWFRALVICSLCAIGFTILHIRMSRLRREHAIQAEFSKKLNEYQETERRRIAGELHDSLGQDLLIIRNSLARLAERSRRGTRLEREVNDINDSVQRTIDEVSKISFDLHPHMLDRLGLKKTLDATIRKYAASSGVNIRGDIDDVDICYAPVEQINIFRIIQEAVNNVVKHAEASTCHVTLRRLPRQCQIVVEDNGRGFDADQTLGAPSGRGGYGLGNMEERVRFLHGSMQVRTAPEKGTTVVFLIPLSARPRKGTA